MQLFWKYPESRFAAFSNEFSGSNVLTIVKKYRTMKKLILIGVLALFAGNTKAQEKELESFKQALNFYIDFTLSKFDSLPVNETNQVRFRKNVDEAFSIFVQNQNSHRYEKFVSDRTDEKSKFLRLDGRISLYLSVFLINSKTYHVYSYNSRDKLNYLIKENESNKIVFEGNGTCYLVDQLCRIDEKHMLLIEKTGDFKTSRDARVLSAKHQRWSIMNVFEGKAFGQVPFEYYNKKYVKRRPVLQLECNFDFTISGPKDINRISFDEKNKTISYKQYGEGGKFTVIAAKWENEIFIIDDYNVNENLAEMNAPVSPR